MSDTEDIRQQWTQELLALKEPTIWWEVLSVIPPGEAMTYAKSILRTGNVDYKLFSNLV